jgi:hypothetical protein
LTGAVACQSHSQSHCFLGLQDDLRICLLTHETRQVCSVGLATRQRAPFCGGSSSPLCCRPRMFWGSTGWMLLLLRLLLLLLPLHVACRSRCPVRPRPPLPAVQLAVQLPILSRIPPFCRSSSRRPRPRRPTNGLQKQQVGSSNFPWRALCRWVHGNIPSGLARTIQRVKKAKPTVTSVLISHMRSTRRACHTVVVVSCTEYGQTNEHRHAVVPFAMHGLC